MVFTDPTEVADDTFSARQPAMTLLSGPLCVFSHSCRVVLREKAVECGVQFVSSQDDPAKLGEFNPYGEPPTLLDRDLTLYDTSVIIEYLDERFPHPPLMSVDPITRAKTRLMNSRLTRDWLRPINRLEETGDITPTPALRKSLHDGLLALSPLFAYQPFFLSPEFTLADAYIVPLLWRLPALGVALPKQAAPLLEYADRMFRRPAFLKSMSPQERALR